MNSVLISLLLETLYLACVLDQPLKALKIKNLRSSVKQKLKIILIQKKNYVIYSTG